MSFTKTFVDSDPSLSSDSPLFPPAVSAVIAYVAAQLASVGAAGSVKYPVQAATTAALAANTYNNGTSGVGATITANANGALPAIDGYSFSLGERILVKDESSSSHNGIYTITDTGDGSHPWVLTRATDYDESKEMLGSVVKVSNGTVNGGMAYYLVRQSTITVGSSTLSFDRLDSASALKTLYTAKGDILVASAASTPGALAVGSDGQLPIANSNSAKGIIYARQTGMMLVSGQYTGSHVSGASSAMNNNRLYYVPIIIHKRVTITAIGINHAATAAGAGSVVRLGIYNSSNSLPSTLLLDAGTVATDTAAGQKFVTISQVLDPGMYWLAAVAQTVSGTPTFSTGTPSMVVSDTANVTSGTKFEAGVTGTLPSSATPGASNTTSPPVIFLGI